MSGPRIIPTAPEVLREALIVIAGAIVAAAAVGAFPQLREWLKQQWGGTPPQGQ